MLTDNNLPEIPALPAHDEFLDRASATGHSRQERGRPEQAPTAAVTESEWSWLAPLIAPAADDAAEPVATDTVATEPIPESVAAAADPVGAVMPPVQRRAPAPNRRRTMILGAFFTGIALVIVVAGVMLSGFIGGSDESSTPVPEPSTEQARASAPAVIDPCPDRVDGATTYGDGVGDQTSGAGAIQAWNHAYYVTRSARAAKSVTTARAVADEPDLQKAIDAVPAGTTHCLVITDRGKGLYAVRLTVTPQQGPPDVLEQLVRTTRAGNRWWIESISKGGA